MDRRAFLQFLGALGLVTASGSLWPMQAGAAKPDLDVELQAIQDSLSVFPGEKTDIWRFAGKVLQGDPNQLQQLEESWLGPIFRLRTGQRVRIRFKNRIPQESIVHWHGLHVAPANDGHPRLAVLPGEEYVYEFTVTNRAGTYWYHPHPHGLTGTQVYGGMAGLFVVSDEEEQALGLPTGDRDLPLVIQDRTFSPTNDLVYLRSPMERMNGFLGNRIMINGQADPTFDVQEGPYRLRLLNGSNSRIYRLAWSDGRNLEIIATDGGLLESPWSVPDIMLGPGERVDLWVDFAGSSQETPIALQSLPFTPGSGHMGMMSSRVSPPLGAGFELARFQVRRTGRTRTSPPQRLARLERLDPAEAVNRDNPKRFFLTMNHMQPTINGRTFDMTEVAPDEMVRLGSTEIWEFINQGSMMAMPHPMHIHGLSFQVIGRFGGPGYRFLDRGWKDTVLVMPGERVAVIMRFADHKGLYLYHCHNLEHEDLGMMRNYLVRS
ncbi:multicopper oxidase family protein [Desulfohalobium retbaense]|uniref:Multicopper oxidase CueO n=1 Tax=Desulfohalobium retbaense (strain ATCC 49708 / DSM 5692 / JCM 16813 / HR100) TaxID=485915 RepID=C8X1D9_DESRD|nr:multicopper oxidase domain-containing protein [Desulfohalobium retbaense]ACV68236.1 multicopper oxidase type 3 [Desulfohalobium retbaense DSM 5692]